MLVCKETILAGLYRKLTEVLIFGIILRDPIKGICSFSGARGEFIKTTCATLKPPPPKASLNTAVSSLPDSKVIEQGHLHLHYML
jgi:hypothetical protein